MDSQGGKRGIMGEEHQTEKEKAKSVKLIEKFPELLVELTNPLELYK